MLYCWIDLSRDFQIVEQLPWLKMLKILQRPTIGHCCPCMAHWRLYHTLIIWSNFTKIQVRVPRIRLITHGWHGNSCLCVFHKFQALQIPKTISTTLDPSAPRQTDPPQSPWAGGKVAPPSTIQQCWMCPPGIHQQVVDVGLEGALELKVGIHGWYCLCIATRIPNKIGWMGDDGGLRVGTLDHEPIFWASGPPSGQQNEGKLNHHTHIIPEPTL